MDTVYIVCSVDANDETEIIRVFSSLSSAESFKENYEASFGSRSSERYSIYEFEVWK